MKPGEILRLGCLAVAVLVLPTACKTSSNSGTQVKDASASSDPTANTSYCNTAAPTAPVPSGLTAGPNCQTLVTNFPQVGDPNVPEDTRVICPFLRIVKRTGLLDSEIAANLSSFWGKNSVVPVGVLKIAAVTPKVGCDGGACAFIAEDVAKNQNGSWPALTVDIGLLASAPPRATFTDQSKPRASHDCGFNFQFGDTAVNDAVREATLAQFQAIAAQNNGQITAIGLAQVKKAMCKRDYALYKAGNALPYNTVDDTNQTLVPDTHDQTEAALIFAYLGGVDNGYVLYDDLNRLFHAQFPANKSQFLLNKALLTASQDAFTGLW